MDETEARTMTVPEIALVRELVRWRKNSRVEWRHYFACWQYPTVYATDHRPVVGAAVTWDPSDGEVGYSLGGTTLHDYTWIKAASVTEAVDLLVALDILPTRFSSAYRAGWEACHVWERSERYDDATFNNLFHDPDNISFPVGMQR